MPMITKAAPILTFEAGYLTAKAVISARIMIRAGTATRLYGNV